MQAVLRARKELTRKIVCSNVESKVRRNYDFKHRSHFAAVAKVFFTFIVIVLPKNNAFDI